MNNKEKIIVSMFVRCAGNQSAEFISYLIMSSDKKREIIGTYEALSKKSSVSISTVKKTMKSLEQQGLIEKIHAGCYRLII